MTELAHFHGYGPWIGRPDQYHAEYLRRPAPFNTEWRDMVDAMKRPDQEAYLRFEERTIPPMRTGHWLLRRPDCLAGQTWRESKEAAEWLAGEFERHPPVPLPDGRPIHPGLSAKVEYAAAALTNGTDVVWMHYLPGDYMFNACVVVCPNRHLPDLPCPLPPS
ncbi:hypothetical protein [Kitasatospora griseola]|uniref:hypothetical protein n=1 Tax=Kitasatospora griseola TaxID=2064 RepID=UPI001670876F|nr:hypothetical protein [Kitasatospora griseola]GGQ93297.1 hypothetical protein GCM10010195_56420 [Kitasatospora griseola]